jgi:hypothetical protein
VPGLQDPRIPMLKNTPPDLSHVARVLLGPCSRKIVGVW